MAETKSSNGSRAIPVLSIIVATLGLLGGTGWAVISNQNEALVRMHNSDIASIYRMMDERRELLVEIKDEIKSLRAELRQR